MKSFFSLTTVSAFLAVASVPSQAGIVFTFAEVGPNVVMNSSGAIDTNGLVFLGAPCAGCLWGGDGVQNYANLSIMGGTSVGQISASYGFSAGTDFSPWVAAGGPWSSSTFPANVDSGTKGFATFIREGGQDPVLPGLGVEAGDIDNAGLWSPDQNWTFAGNSFAAMGMTTGTYTVTDATTGEFITFQIGGQRVPEPGSLALLGLGLAGLGAARRRKH